MGKKLLKSKPVSDRLKAAIEGSGLTRYAVAKAAGVAQITVDRFMEGTRDLRLATADKLAVALGLELKPKS